ncbi:sensor histidine kinase [Dyadobacter luteus]|nr:HAMP domain-containing sensor histidine kinase [Dyadobacter luteus]
MFITSVTASGQPVKNKYTIRNFTDENGLPQNSVKSMVADNLGFIWLQTESGLARFDGQRIVSMSQFFKDGMDRGQKFLPDLLGNSNKINTYHPDNASVRIENGRAVLDQAYKVQEMMALMGFNVLTIDLAQDISEGMLKRINFLETLHYSVSGCKGCAYIVTANHIKFYSDFKLQWVKSHNFPNFKNFFVLDGQLYYLTEDGTVAECAQRAFEPMKIFGDVLYDKEWEKGNYKHELFANTLNQQAFLLIEDRFYYLKIGKEGTWNTELLLESFSFKTNGITSVYYEERSGNLLVGSRTRGLTVIKKQNFLSLVLSKDDDKNVTYSQISMDSNTVLLPGGRVVGIRKSGGNLLEERQTAGVVHDVNATSARYALRDKLGRMWIAEERFVVIYSSDGNKVLHKIAVDNITTLFESWNGEILVGSKGRGLFSLSLNSKEVRSFYNPADMKDVVCIQQTDSSHLVLGTEKGLYRFNLLTRVRELVPGTENLFVRSLYLRGKGDELFFTTFHHGFFYYDGKRLTQFPLDANRYLAAAHCIVEDRNGYFWITTNRGLFQAKVEDLYNYVKRVQRGKSTDLFYLYHTKEEGFNTNEFNGGCSPCAVRLKNGFVSLPSLMGLVLFEPEYVTPVLPDRPLVIDFVEEHNVLRQITGDRVKLSLNPRNISFHLNTAYFGNPENLHISYVLKVGTEKPADSEWLPVEEGKPIARFTEIASGEYTLWVRKTDGFGFNKYSIQKLAVSVPLHWYEMLWFRIALAVFVLGLVYALFYIRTRRLLARNEQLERHVAERTRNLQEALDSLQTSEKELSRQMQLQSRLVASISHDVSTPIHYFAKASDMAGDMIRGEDNEGARKFLKEVSSSARQIYTFVENLVTFSKSQIYGLHTNARPVLVHKLIEDKVRIFKNVLSQRGISFHNEVPVELEIATSPQLLGIMVHNLIDNALKHSYEHYDVRVKTELGEGGIHLIFSNPGQGFPDSVIQWLNQPPHVSQNVPQEYSGLGLLIIKEISEILHVGLYAENNNGAHVHLIFSDYME